MQQKQTKCNYFMSTINSGLKCTKKVQSGCHDGKVSDDAERVEKTCSELKVCELTRTAYQKLLK